VSVAVNLAKTNQPQHRQMPTGYTAAIADGIDFPTFAMDCARAFGACITLRDEPGGGDKIPESFEPDNYYQESIDRVHAKMAELRLMSPAEVDRKAEQEWKDEEAQRIERLQEKADLRAKYEAMVAEAESWTPPTPEHVGLKQFMIDQINESIRFDCSTAYLDNPVERLSGEAWLADQLKRCESELQYYEAQNRKEIERASERTAWVRVLRDSLKQSQSLGQEGYRNG
jgi:hypothetical protein